MLPQVVAPVIAGQILDALKQHSYTLGKQRGRESEEEGCAGERERASGDVQDCD